MQIPLKTKQSRLEYHRKYRVDNIEKRRKWNRDWIANNKERYNASKYIYREKLKDLVISFYSKGTKKCLRCGVSDIDVLCIDHINNNGAEDRKSKKVSGNGNANGINIYDILKKEDFPEGYQVLCANCNLKKEIELKRNIIKMKNKYYLKRKGVVPDANHNTL